ncbi:unnamed protein product [Arabis nemorensis]|uniref:Uncharacterized protein n=1 Tax=Arabis nemorensis TaxID=586526 RepID=A0A565AYA5_9BRAS|nr:unnamed protein product [Arabis nemorensis]
MWLLSRQVQRVALLKNWIDALGSGLDAAKDLKEIESYLSSVTIQASEDLKKNALKVLVTLANDYLESGFFVDDLMVGKTKNKERFLRGRYIRKMIELNNKEREFEETFGLSLVTDGGIGETATFVKLSEDQRTTMEIVCDIKTLMHEEQQLTKKFLDYQQKTKNLEENLKENHDVLVDEIFNLQTELGDEKRLHANLQKMLVDEKRLN